MTVILTIVN